MKNRIPLMALVFGVTLSTQTLMAYADNEERQNERKVYGGKLTKTSPILNHFDTDGDGKISKEEAPIRMKKNFAKHDLNKDGYIAGDELDTLPKHPKGQRRNNAKITK